MSLRTADMSVLVVGGAGFVGSNLVRALLRDGVAAIHVVDNLLSAETENLPVDPRLTLSIGSIADDAVLATLEDRYDFIYHLATYHGNQSSIHNPIADHDNNLITTLKLLERIKTFRRLQKLVYAAAGCAVAEKTFATAQATQEDAPISLDMDSPYSISKIAGEFYCRYYFTQHQVPTVRARFQNVYGPGEVLGAGQWRGTPASVWRNVTPTFIFKSLKKAALPVEGCGDATRDFIFVEDIVRGLICCALRGQSGGVYNLASGRETSILTWATLINRLTANPTPIEFRPARAWDHSGKRFGSTEKATQQLGFAAEAGIEDGLKRTIDWTIANLPFIEQTMLKHRHWLPDVVSFEASARSSFCTPS